MTRTALILICLLAPAILAPAQTQTGEGRAIAYTASGSVTPGALVQIGELGLGCAATTMVLNST